MTVQFQQRVLENGLTLVAEPNPQAHTAAVGFFVKTGARDEQREVMGVSHFLEHMVFKGTDRRTADQVNQEFDQIGADYNAYTSHEQTVYYAHVLPEFLPRAVDLLADILRPALREADFEMEKNVILEEIGMYEDRPHWRLQDMLLEQYFSDHPLGFRVLGTPQTVTDLTAEQMRAYFGQRYSSDNIIVSAAGNVDFDALVDQVAGLTAQWKPARAKRQYLPVDLASREHNLCDEKVARHYLAIAYPGPSFQDESRYAAKVLSDIVGDSEGSRLYWALIDPGLADEADLSIAAQDQLGCYIAYACCDPDRAEQVESILLSTLESAGKDLSADEVERAKNKLATSATVSGERPNGRMSNLGVQYSYLGRYVSLEEDLHRLMAVTVDDVQALLADRPFQLRTTVRLGPR